MNELPHGPLPLSHYAWQTKLKVGDPIQADHPRTDNPVRGRFVKCWGGSCCEMVDTNGKTQIVYYRDVIRVTDEDLSELEPDE